MVGSRIRYRCSRWLAGLVAACLAGGALAKDAVFSVAVDGNFRGVLGRPHGKAPRGQRVKQDLLESARPPLLLSTGNVLGPSSSSYVDGGAPVLELMNRLPYDAMALGALDLFQGPEDMLHVIENADFPVVASNLRPRDREGALAKAWEKAIRRRASIERGGAHLIVLGLLSTRSLGFGPQLDDRLEVLEPAAVLEELVGEVGKEDTLVVLGNLSFDETLRLFRRFPRLDFAFLNRNPGESDLLASSLDHGLPDGRRIVWVPYFGRYVALLEIQDGEKRRAFVEAVPLDDDGPKDMETVKLVRERRRRRAVERDTILTTLEDHEVDDFRMAVAQALRAETGAEVAAIRRGTLRTAGVPRHLSRSALRAAYPFVDRATTFWVRGKKLRELWEKREESPDRTRHLVLPGISERGGVVLVNERALDNQARYRVSTVGRLLTRDVGVFDEKTERREGKETFLLLMEHFERTPAERRSRIRHVERRTARRHRTTFDFTRRESSFGGSAPEFQQKVPGRANVNSTVPGLVGREFITSGFLFHHTTTLDRPRHDWTFDLDAKYSTFNSTTVNEYLDGFARYERKDPIRRRPLLFGAVDFNTILGDQDLPDQEKPFFAKIVGGLSWKTGPKTKIRAGLGHIRRFSLPSNPGATGMNFGVDWERTTGGLTLKTQLDGFFTAGSEKIRTGDFTLELRLKVDGPLSMVLRQSTFLWRDNTVTSSAVRNDTFVGLGLNRRIRKF